MRRNIFFLGGIHFETILTRYFDFDERARERTKNVSTQNTTKSNKKKKNVVVRTPGFLRLIHLAEFARVSTETYIKKKKSRD